MSQSFYKAHKSGSWSVPRILAAIGGAAALGSVGYLVARSVQSQRARGPTILQKQGLAGNDVQRGVYLNSGSHVRDLPTSHSATQCSWQLHTSTCIAACWHVYAHYRM